MLLVLSFSPPLFLNLLRLVCSVLDLSVSVSQPDVARWPDSATDFRKKRRFFGTAAFVCADWLMTGLGHQRLPCRLTVGVR